MGKLPYLVIAVIVLMSLAACGGLWTLSRSTDHIVLRWWNDEVAGSQADSVANAYCSQMGKAAQLDSLEQDGSASIGHYRCV